MKKLLTLEGSCVLVALHYVTGVPEDTVKRYCEAYNFTPKEGIDDKDWIKVAKALGIKMRSQPPLPLLLSQFIKKHKAGLYIVSTFDHLFVVDNGIIFDPRNLKPPGLSRNIVGAWKVNKDDDG